MEEDSEDRLHSRRICRGVHCKSFDDVNMVSRRVDVVTKEPSISNIIVETKSLSQYSLPVDIKVTEVTTVKSIPQVHLINPVALADFVFYFSLFTITIIIIVIRTLFVLFYTKKKLSYKTDGIKTIKHIKRIDSSPYSSSSSSSAMIEDLDLLQVVTRDLEYICEYDQMDNILNCYRIINQNLNAYLWESLHQNDIPINYEQLLNCDTVFKIIHSIENISDKLVNRNGSFKDNLMGKRDEFCVRALGSHVNMEDKLDELHAAIIYCSGLGVMPEMDSTKYKAKLNRLYFEIIHRRARELSIEIDENLQIMNNTDDYYYLIENSSIHELPMTMEPRRAISEKLEGDIVIIEGEENIVMIGQQQQEQEQHNSNSIVNSNNMNSQAIRRQKFSRLCQSVKNEQNSRQLAIRSRIDTEIRNMESSIASFNEKEKRSMATLNDRKKALIERKYRNLESYSKEKESQHKIDSLVFIVLSLIIIGIYMKIKLVEMNMGFAYDTKLSIGSFIKQSIKPICEYISNHSDISHDTSVDYSITSFHITHLLDWLSYPNIIASLFYITPSTLLSTIPLFLSSILGLDSNDSKCLYGCVGAIAPVLIVSMITSVIYRTSPSILVKYVGTVIELAMIVDYIIVPILSPLGTTWPILLLLLVNYAISFAIEQCDSKIRWSHHQTPSNRRWIILYVIYPIIMISIANLIARNAVCDLYYYCRLFRII